LNDPSRRFTACSIGTVMMAGLVEVATLCRFVLYFLM
jgi:hypothetical protein